MPAGNLKERLTNLYKDNSKHSNYQNIPEFVKERISYSELINEDWRGDTARYQYIVEEIKKKKLKSICDIGANTGFFSLSLAHEFPNILVTAFEGNKNHVEFMKLVKDAFSLENIEIENHYIDYDGIEKLGNYDMMLNLNVLHHAGVDFDKDKTTHDTLDAYLVKYLKKLTAKTQTIILQMGYNWGGDKSKPIIELQNDFGKIQYSLQLFEQSGWEIHSLSHITKNETLQYKSYPSTFVENLYKDRHNVDLLEFVSTMHLDRFSEFYRRPIFILKQLSCHDDNI